QNIKRDPFEQNVLPTGGKSAASLGGSLGSPGTAFLYDWNILPIGQLLWTKELMSYKEFPPLQAPESYNLSGILREMEKSSHPSNRRRAQTRTPPPGLPTRAPRLYKTSPTCTTQKTPAGLGM